ncbi:MAG: NAD-dependent epimerase/dehydratase family protein [Spirochaetota bacterium]
MKVIVTGGSGKAGRHVVESLVAGGHEVINVDRVHLDALPVRTIRIDLEDTGAVYDVFGEFRPDGVCHLAANPSPSGFARSDTFRGNTMITYNVMQASGDLGVKRFVSAGSEMATGWLTTEELPPRFPFTEEDRVPSGNAYALSKFMSEVIADSLSVRYPAMPICTLRINNVIPPEKRDEMLRPRRERYPGPGSANFWSYIDARDVGGAFRAALEGESAGHEVFLIAAADTCIEVPIRQAVKERYGREGNFASGHGDFDSAFDCGKMERFFGWKPAHSWRDPE